MEKLANKIASYIQTELSLDDKNYQIINYGMIAIVQIIAFAVILFITGLIFNTMLEGYILTLCVAILRKSSGGAHASSLEICTTIGVIASVILTLTAKYILSVYLNTVQAAILTGIIYIYCFIIAYKLIPVDNPNKRIQSDKKKKRLRRESFIVLILGLVMSLGLIISEHSLSTTSYSFCITLALFWQIFSLTKPGALLFYSLDNCLRIIIDKINNRRIFK